MMYMNTLIVPLVVAVAMSFAASAARTSGKEVAAKQKASVVSVSQVANDEKKDELKDFSMKLKRAGISPNAVGASTLPAIPAKPAAYAKRELPRGAAEPNVAPRAVPAIPATHVTPVTPAKLPAQAKPDEPTPASAPVIVSTPPTAPPASVPPPVIVIAPPAPPAVVPPVVTASPPSQPTVTIPVIPPEPLPTAPADSGVDLVVQRIWIRAEPSGLRRVMITFGNQGNMVAPVGVGHIQYTVDGRETLGYFLKYLAYQTFRDPQGSTTIESNYLVSDATRTVSVTVDPFDAIHEYNENNNTLTTTLSASRADLPDLVVTAVQEQPGEFLLTVKNIGSVDLTSETMGAYLYERTAVGTALIARLEGIPLGPLQANGASSQVVSVPVLSGAKWYYPDSQVKVSLPPGVAVARALDFHVANARNDADTADNIFDF